MGLFDAIFGKRRRESARRALEARVRAILEAEGPGPAWSALEVALRADPDPVPLFHLAAHVLRLGGERATAELFDRAADAPHDPQRLFELGSELTSAEQPEAGAAMLERALAFAPFDAVVRSELAIAQARAGWPDRVVETLALHPCLAEDPGALYQFGWASMLCGDLRAAEGALGELAGVPELSAKLRGAIARARLCDGEPPSARRFAFVEHGALLLDDGGPLGGRYARLEADGAWIGRTLAALGWALAELVPPPRRVIALDEATRPLAQAVARASGGALIERGRGRLPSGVVVVFDAGELEALERESAGAEGALVVALTMDFTRRAPRVPDVVGAFARVAELDREAVASAPAEADVDPSLRRFVEARRAHLPPSSGPLRGAYVPDEPLPR
ncbi:MAG: hypothetical protein M5U28_14340 [Sandaracinaceae bacterium]|nr:hypothetical protein [Sandaracinaceae bacterium]